MSKPFQSVNIDANDDGTFSIRVYPVPEKKDGKDDMVCYGGASKTMTATTLEECFDKIKSKAGKSIGKKAADMKEYFNMKDEK